MKNLTKMTENTAPIGQKLIGVEYIKLDRTVKSIEFMFENGAKVLFAGEHWEPAAWVPAPPKMVKAFKLEGEVGGALKIKVAKVFSDRSDARRYLENLKSEVNIGDLEVEEIEIDEEKIPELANDDGHGTDLIPF